MVFLPTGTDLYDLKKLKKILKVQKNLTQQPGIKVKNQRGAVLIKF